MLGLVLAYMQVRCTCICKHDAKSSCSDFSDMQVHMQGTCIVFALYLHCICIVFALYLHCICIVFALCLHGAACICKSHASPRNTLSPPSTLFRLQVLVLSLIFNIFCITPRVFRVVRAYWLWRKHTASRFT